MENAVIRFRAKGQNLSLVSGYNRFAGNTIGYIRIEIEPDDEWLDFDSVDALFQNEQGRVSAVLFYDSGVYVCNAPVEMTAASSVVFLNLSGKNVVNNVLVERLTTYPVFAFAIDRSANVTSYRETEVSANMYEQYIAAVGDQVEKITDLTVSAHEADEPEVIKTATPGLPINLDFGLVRGETGEQGIPGEPGSQGEPGVPGEKGDPFTYDDFTEEQLAALVGPQGPKGSTGDPAGFGNVTAEVDNSVGTPSVEVATAGPDTAKNIHFTFSNLKGVHGDPIDVQIDGTSIVSDSVANIPKANINDWGVVKTSTATLTAENYSYTKLTHMSGASEVVRNLATMSLASFTQRGLMSKDDKVKLAHIASGAEVNVQSDWNQTDTSADDYIKNKPSVPTKVSDLENDVPYVEESQLSALLPTDTASGAIASFPDGQSVIPALSVKAQIEPIQSGSGTPSPDNIRPISGRTEVVTEVCGANIWGGLKMAQDIADIVPNSVLNTARKIIQYEASKVADKILYDGFLPNTQYTIILHGDNLSATAKTPNLKVDYTDGTSANIQSFANNSTVFVTDPEKSVSVIKGVWASSATILDYEQCGIFEGNLTADQFEPYTNASYTTSLGRTVYGGTLDVVSGELVVDRVMVDLSTLDFSYDSSGQRWQKAMPDIYNYPSRNGNLVAEKYVADTSASAGSEGKMFTVGKGLYIYSTDGTTPPSGNLVYPLATPQTYQLDPQTIDLLLGQNNLWTDCGAVEVTYKADIQGYIDKEREAVSHEYDRMIAPTETKYIATQNYTTGSLLIVDGVLYKVTSNIANGGTITPNTNCTATTLSEVISALA